MRSPSLRLWPPSLFAVQIVALGILSFLLAAASVNAWEASRARKAAESWYTHTLDVLLETSRLREGVYAELRGERGYLLTHDRSFLRPFFAGQDHVRIHTGMLAELTDDNPVQVANMAMLTAQLRAYEAMLSRAVSLEQQGRHDAAVAIVRMGLGRQELERVLGIIDRMDVEEKRLLKQRRDGVDTAMHDNDHYQYLLSILGFLLVVLSLWTAINVHRLQLLAAELNAELEELASSDALTGLANRRAFFSELDRDRGQVRSSAVAILDVDHFKRVNDVHGHPVGDRLLREIALVLTAAVRSTDTVARIGGEEFAILMPDTTVKQAMQACERARAAVEAHVVALGNNIELHVSISVGVALRGHGDTPESWITKADKALYRAKEAGRNRVLLAA